MGTLFCKWFCCMEKWHALNIKTTFLWTSTTKLRCVPCLISCHLYIILHLYVIVITWSNHIMNIGYLMSCLILFWIKIIVPFTFTLKREFICQHFLYILNIWQNSTAVKKEHWQINEDTWGKTACLVWWRQKTNPCLVTSLTMTLLPL